MVKNVTFVGFRGVDRPIGIRPCFKHNRNIWGHMRSCPFENNAFAGQNCQKAFDLKARISNR